MTLQSINPATDEVIQQFDELSDEQLEQKLALAQTAFEQWKQTPLETRVEALRAMARIIRQDMDKFASTITSEVGKTLEASRAELEKCAATLDFYAENAAEYLQPKLIPSDASKSYLRYDPIGAVLAVMPWNFPFWQVIRFLAPALAAGNVGLLKHASNVQLSAMAIEEIVERSGAIHGVFQNLAISPSRVEAVINDARVRAVTLTGSEYAGSQVAMNAGRALKKTVLELGGSDPFIVLKDADIDAAVDAAVTGRLQANAGQSCIAAKRFIVDVAIEEEFTKKLVAKTAALRVGDPTDPETQVGPMVNKQGVEEIERQVRESVAAGATIAVGGEQIDGAGCYYQPTVLTGVKKGMPAYDEELFGPVSAVMSFETEDQAIMIANDTIYGLGSTIFTADESHAEVLAQQIDAGQVFINHQVKSDPRLPFGGVKSSGYGRELSYQGMYEFVNSKTVWIR